MKRALLIILVVLFSAPTWSQQVDPTRLGFESARASVAGPRSVYISSMLYDGKVYSALFQYDDQEKANFKSVYEGADNIGWDSHGSYIESAKGSLAGPNAVYIRSIRFEGKQWSARLSLADDGSATITDIYPASDNLFSDSEELTLASLQMEGCTIAIPGTMKVSEAVVRCEAEGFHPVLTSK
jgi:hypothetical protein